MEMRGPEGVERRGRARSQAEFGRVGSLIVIFVILLFFVIH